MLSALAGRATQAQITRQVFDIWMDYGKRTATFPILVRLAFQLLPANPARYRTFMVLGMPG